VAARAPASSANLGPGFDVLAVALQLYVEVDVVLADSLSVEAKGRGSGEFDDERHLGVRVARDVLGHDRFAIRVDSQIPVSRGLGSSASLALAAAAAAGAEDPLSVAVAYDGHAENAAASMRGGLVSAATVGGATVVHRHHLDPDIRFVLVVPEARIETHAAREALPASVALADATFNMSRLAMLLAGMADLSALRAEAMEDRLHQRYRGALMPDAEAILDGLRDAGALATAWSGSGSTMLAVVASQSADTVARAASELISEISVPAEVIVTAADTEGLVTE
jgi:homoserine kinase